MSPPVALVQGIYFLVTGIWPLISMGTFLAVTGPKKDLWLVKTVGLILAVIGAVLIFAQQTAAVNTPVAFLAIGAAASLTIVEIVYVLKKGISPIYLGDAFVEIILMIWWGIELSVA
jgi:energy-converting hydrogenase Eha subunit E